MKESIAHKEDIELYYDSSSPEKMADYSTIIPYIRDIDAYKHFQNITLSGFPLCIFPREKRAWTGFVSLLEPRPDNVFVEKCADCRFREMCLGAPQAYIDKFSEDALRPPSDEDLLFIRDYKDISCIKPYWGFNVNNQKYYYNLFFKNIPGKILDIGAGMGEFVSLDPTRITGVDNDLESINNAMAESLGLDLRYGDACRLDFADEEFKAVFCLFVLEHMSFEEAKKAIKEMSRVLKPGGKLLLITQGKDGSDGWPGDKPTTKYTRESFEQMLEPGCFRRTKIINGAYIKPYAGFNFDAPEEFPEKEIAIGLMAEK